MRKKIIAGNWKMNKTNSEAQQLVEELKAGINKNENVEVVICPPFIAIQNIKSLLDGSEIKVGAQNMHFEDKGAFTGEIAPNMLLDLGVEYVIIGHSERRQYFNETDETVNKKVKKALDCGLKPIICVGESLEQRENEETLTFIKKQIENGLKEIPEEKITKCTIAYEPIWAIGTGKTATKEQAEEVCKYIREVLSNIYSVNIAEEITIQYGGSVTADNAVELFSMPNIDGALVGGASLKVEQFSAIARA